MIYLGNTISGPVTELLCFTTLKTYAHRYGLDSSRAPSYIRKKSEFMGVQIEQEALVINDPWLNSNNYGENS